jgi:hypothetical protein
MEICESCHNPDHIYRIHPAIGVARVGNSPREFFLAPEKPGVRLTPDIGAYDADLRGVRGISKTNTFKDVQGRIKRQAVRFRVFEYTRLADGTYKCTGEVTADRARLTWTVELANLKGEAPSELVDVISSGSRGDQFAIKAIKRVVVGRKAHHKKLHGSSPGNPLAKKGKVYLGEILTDRAGRLIVLGGRGKAMGTRKLTEFYTNVGWSDDVSDGPVKVQIRFYGSSTSVPAEDIRHAWVVVAPPDYAPGIQSVTTLYDRLYDIWAWRKHLPKDFSKEHEQYVIYQLHDLLKRKKTHFKRDIEPIFKRTLALEWTFGVAWKKHPKLAKLEENTALDNSHISAIRKRLRGIVLNEAKDALGSRLNDNNLEKILRKELKERLGGPPNIGGLERYVESFKWRNYVFQTVSPPGERIRDVNQDNPPEDPASRLKVFWRTMPALLGETDNKPTITMTQHDRLRDWCTGLFVDTRRSNFTGDPSWFKVPIKPEGLDRASLESCCGGAFFPGMEVSLAALQPSAFLEPFRIDHEGEVHGFKIKPGFFTQQMALPWQADFYDCADEGKKVWWPSHRPIDTFRSAEDASGGEKDKRQGWAADVEKYRYRPLSELTNTMVHRWSTLGFVVKLGKLYVERKSG